MHRLFILSLISLLFACQNNSNNSTEDRSTVDLSQNVATQADQAIIQQFNEGDIRFFRESDDMVIGIIEDILRAPVLQTAKVRLSASEKGTTRTYSENNRKKYEVKYVGNDIQLFDKNGTFLYAARAKEKSFLLGFDEAITNYYDIPYVKESNARILYRGSTLGNLYYVDESVFVSAFGERYYVQKNGFHPGYAVISMTRIPLDQRLILITELFQMGF